MRALPLFALTLILAGCGDQAADPAAQAPAETPIPVEPDGGIGDGAGPPLDPAIAAGEIPARFHGVWDALTGTCDPASDMRVEIAKRGSNITRASAMFPAWEARGTMRSPIS